MATKIDLITGFLGSGKTTFLKQYVHYLFSKGEHIAILEFDYGAINVDMMLLQEFNGSCDLEMVAGGCDYDCHLRRFKTKLIALGMKKYDRVIIEPSGIFDPDEFFDTLYESPLSDWYEIGSVLTIVDAGISSHLSRESRYILAAQIASSGAVILSKTQLYPLNRTEETVTYLRSLCEEAHIHLNEDRIIRKPFSEFAKEDYAFFEQASYLLQSYEKHNFIGENDYSSVYFMNTKMSLEKAKTIAETLLNDSDFGNVIRIKGFIYDQDGWWDINFTRNENHVENIPMGQDVVIVIGEHLNEEKIKSLLDSEKS